MKKLVIFLLVLTGGIFGLVWWFNVEQTGGSFSDFFSDPIGGLQSVGSKISLWLQSLYEQLSGATGGIVNSKTLAASKIADFEGFVGHAYPDPPGQSATYSIGYGHKIIQGDGFNLESTISESDAIALLVADLDTSAANVDNVVTVDISPEQKAALYSLDYNIGSGNFNNSTLLRELNSGADANTVAAQFAVWNKQHVNGVLEISDSLTARRSAEAELFLSGANTTVDSSINSITETCPDGNCTQDETQ